MDEQEQLRDRLDRQRDEVSQTVDQIENRVAPGRVMARGGWRARQRVTGLKERVMGSHDEDHPYATGSPYGLSATPAPYGYPSGSGATGDSPGRGEQAADGARHMAEKAGEAPDAVRRQAQGNPLAAGVIAFGAGLLVAAMLPETRQERRAVARVEPQLQQVAERAGEQSREAADELREPAQDAAESVRSAGVEAAQTVKGDATDHAGQAADEARS